MSSRTGRRNAQNSVMKREGDSRAGADANIHGAIPERDGGDQPGPGRG